MGGLKQSANAGLHRRRARTAAYRGDRGDGSEVTRSVIPASPHLSPEGTGRRASSDARRVRGLFARISARRDPSPEAFAGAPASTSPLRGEVRTTARLNTPPSCWPPCWSAPGRDSSRSCRELAQNSRAHLL